jgi:hypothetical protein
MSGGNPKKDEGTGGGSTKSFRDHLHGAVESVNGFLAAIQDATENVRSPIVKGIDTIETGGSVVAAKAVRMYERRHEFGPHIVGGSSLLSGGIVTARRGRIPGVLVGAAVGGIAYLAVYESIPLSDVPDALFGKKKD